MTGFGFCPRGLRMSNRTVEIHSSGSVPHLRRVLGVWDLVFYGLVAVTPCAPATVFGLAQVKSRGHAVDTILIAMVAMVLTAVSYGRMVPFILRPDPPTPMSAAAFIPTLASLRVGPCFSITSSHRCSVSCSAR